MNHKIFFHAGHLVRVAPFDLDDPIAKEWLGKIVRLERSRFGASQIRVIDPKTGQRGVFRKEDLELVDPRFDPDVI